MTLSMASAPSERTMPLHGRRNSKGECSTPTPMRTGDHIQQDQARYSSPGAMPYFTSTGSPRPYLRPTNLFHVPSTRRQPRQPFWCKLKLLSASKIRTLIAVLLASALFSWVQVMMPIGQSQVPVSYWGREFSISSDIDAEGLKFVPALHPMVQYVGRWVPTPNRLRIDGTFAGAYIHLNVTNTSTVFLSLKNSADATTSKGVPGHDIAKNLTFRSHPKPDHLSFHRSPELEMPGPPLVLIARINDDEYVVIANSSGLVRITDSLNPSTYNSIKIIMPSLDSDIVHVLQLEGLWLNSSGVLVARRRPSANGALLSTDSTDADTSTSVEDADEEGKALENSISEAVESVPSVARRKVLEVLTDAPGLLTRKVRIGHHDSIKAYISGVMGWEYLIGEMFDIDHVTVAIDGMCLIQDCIGGTGFPEGFANAFFRSGPPRSAYFEYPWLFDSYIPDVLILNLGQSDADSFSNYHDLYSKDDQTLWDLHTSFEDTYVSLVQAIRQLAYPLHPSRVHLEQDPSNVPADIPIFIMRPLTGVLEHSTLGAVSRLRAGGDSSVYWIDTSGWLDVPNNSSQNQSPDFWIDDSVQYPVARLTELGNQRVAMFLHEYVCRYLAIETDQCAFLAPDIYEGKDFQPEELALERVLEMEREKRLKHLFNIDKGLEAHIR